MFARPEGVPAMDPMSFMRLNRTDQGLLDYVGLWLRPDERRRSRQRNHELTAGVGFGQAHKVSGLPIRRVFPFFTPGRNIFAQAKNYLAAALIDPQRARVRTHNQ
jgi:hypothetical protein